MKVDAQTHALMVFLTTLGCSGISKEDQVIWTAAASEARSNSTLGMDRACARARSVLDAAESSGLPPRGRDTRQFSAQGCFVGTITSVTDPYSGSVIEALEDGVLAFDDTGIARRYDYIDGRFLYLQAAPGDPVGDTYIAVGRRVERSGGESVGIFIAEGTLEFLPADKGYLQRAEQRHAEGVARFRAEQAQRMASKRSNISFGQALALGLGGAVIVASGIPPEKMVEVGAALATDVMTDGQAGALAELTQQYSEELENSTASYTAGPESAGGLVRWTCDASGAAAVCVEYETPSSLVDGMKASCAHSVSDGWNCADGLTCEHEGDKGLARTYYYGPDEGKVKSECAKTQP